MNDNKTLKKASFIWMLKLVPSGLISFVAMRTNYIVDFEH